MRFYSLFTHYLLTFWLVFKSFWANSNEIDFLTKGSNFGRSESMHHTPRLKCFKKSKKFFLGQCLKKLFFLFCFTFLQIGLAFALRIGIAHSSALNLNLSCRSNRFNFSLAEWMSNEMQQLLHSIKTTTEAIPIRHANCKTNFGELQ